MLQHYPEPKTGNGLDLAMRTILVGAVKGLYVSLKNLVNVTGIIVFRNSLNRRRKTKREFIVGRQLVTSSSPTYIFMILVLLMGR